MVPALLGPCITLYKTRGKSLLAAQMHGGFWQFGVLVVATSHQPPPPAAVDFYPPHPALLEPNFLFSRSLALWLAAGWLASSMSFSLSISHVCLVYLHASPPISLLFSLALAAPSSLSLPPPACCSELGSCKNSPHTCTSNTRSEGTNMAFGLR